MKERKPYINSIVVVQGLHLTHRPTISTICNTPVLAHLPKTSLSLTFTAPCKKSLIFCVQRKGAIRWLCLLFMLLVTVGREASISLCSLAGKISSSSPTYRIINGEVTWGEKKTASGARRCARDGGVNKTGIMLKRPFSDCLFWSNGRKNGWQPALPGHIPQHFQTDLPSGLLISLELISHYVNPLTIP